MNFQLTDEIIREGFSKTGVGKEFFPIYAAEVKCRYDSYQNDIPDDEESSEVDNNVSNSIGLAGDYIQYYAAEVEKGHSHKWAHSYASDMVSGEKQILRIQNALGQYEKEEDKKRELDIHVRSINGDPIFVSRYKSIIYDDSLQYEDLYETAMDYNRIYRKCIDNGRSGNYAHAFADACNRDISAVCCDIHAQAYELARKRGMGEDAAMSFAWSCGDAWGDGLVHEMKSFFECYTEDWQKDFYISLIRREYSESDINEILKWG